MSKIIFKTTEATKKALDNLNGLRVNWLGNGIFLKCSTVEVDESNSKKRRRGRTGTQRREHNHTLLDAAEAGSG